MSSRKSTREQAFAGPDPHSARPVDSAHASPAPMGAVGAYPAAGAWASQQWGMASSTQSASYSAALSSSLLQTLCSPAALKLLAHNGPDEPMLKRWHGEPSGRGGGPSWAQYYAPTGTAPHPQPFPAHQPAPTRTVAPRGTTATSKRGRPDTTSCVLQFSDFSGHSSAISGQQLKALGKYLGWPATSSPHFFAVCYACFHHNAGDDNHTTLHHGAWERVFASFDDDVSLDSAASQLWAQIEASFGEPSGGLFGSFHRFLFDFLLLFHLDADSPAVAASSQLPAEVRPRRLGVFCRKLPRLTVTLALLVTLGRVSPWARIFVQYLDDSRVRVVRQDEWRSLLPFVHKVHYPSTAGYCEDDGWPCMLDDFVAWFRQHAAEQPVEED